ncbi:MAG: hypothetical protein JKY65_26210 [Planctomycetes bacterium]|nr:hypothetical protein [Planctomycetota bacterium]
MSSVFLFAGCNRGGTGGGKSSSASTAAGATAGVDMGAIAYDMLHNKYETAGELSQMSALEGRRDDFVGAVNRILPADISNNLFPTLMSLLPLVDNGFVEGAATDIDAIIVDLLQDQKTLDSLAKLLNTPGARKRAGADHSRNQLISRLLAYPEMEELTRSSLRLLRSNDGMDDAGNPNGERNLLREIQGAVARGLKNYQPSANNTQASSVATSLNTVADALLGEQPMNAFPNLGAPAWAVKIDKYGNPAVTVLAGNTLPAPFVDNDGDRVADVNVDFEPIDAAGTPIRIAPFGVEGTRDSFGRALAGGNSLYYQYFDAKRTLLSEILLLTGELIKRDVAGKTVTVLDKLATRYTHDNGTPGDTRDDWDTLSPDSPFVDLAYAQFELIKFTPLPQLLKGVAQIVKNDPAKFGEMVDKLIVALSKARAAASTTQTAGSAAGLVNDLLPLLEASLQHRGRGTSAIRALLQAFNTEQRRLKTLPVTFARMMKYSSYKNRILADANNKSAMQQILEMMDGANKCNAPGLGNMAEFYLKVMAGNQRILGININISTVHLLLNIGFLRNLLCSNIKASDVLALKDFNDSGALDAMKPIAKVFDDRGEITLLKDIMLGLGRHYEAVMRPTEPTVVAVLESGALEILFEVIDDMTQQQVPGTNDVVADVLADTLEAVISTATPRYDRKGQPHDSLAKMMLVPLNELGDKAKTAGVEAELESISGSLGDVLLATYTDANGEEKWKWEGLKSSLGDVLEAVADNIPSDPTDRARWAAEEQIAVEKFLTGRDLVLGIDVLTAIATSPDKATINKAIVNLFTPQQSAQFDAFGGILILVSESLGRKKAQANSVSTIDEAALADVLHFMGRHLDPNSNSINGIIELIRQFIRADDGLLILRLARNALDKGVNGTDPSAVETLTSVFDDISAAAPASTGPATSAGLRDSLQGAHDFINDSDKGLPYFIAKIKARSK